MSSTQRAADFIQPLDSEDNCLPEIRRDSQRTALPIPIIRGAHLWNRGTQTYEIGNSPTPCQDPQKPSTCQTNRRLSQSLQKAVGLKTSRAESTRQPLHLVLDGVRSRVSLEMARRKQNQTSGEPAVRTSPEGSVHGDHHPWEHWLNGTRMKLTHRPTQTLWQVNPSDDKDHSGRVVSAGRGRLSRDDTGDRDARCLQANFVRYPDNQRSNFVRLEPLPLVLQARLTRSGRFDQNALSPQVALAETLTAADNVDTVLHLDPCQSLPPPPTLRYPSPGRRTKRAVTKWDHSTEGRLSVALDGSPRRSGCLTTIETPGLSAYMSLQQDRVSRTRSLITGPTLDGDPDSMLKHNRYPLNSNDSLSPPAASTAWDIHLLTLSPKTTMRDTVSIVAEKESPPQARTRPPLPHMRPLTLDSPASLTWSDSDCESQHGYLTPMTSPDTSPRKRNSRRYRLSDFRQIPQLDGEAEIWEDNSTENEANSDGDKRVLSCFGRRAFDIELNGVDCHERERLLDWTTSQASCFVRGSQDERGCEDEETLSKDTGPGEDTPLVPPSLAKGAQAFPFPSNSRSVGLPPISRHPSVLLRFCEGRATQRQLRLMNGGISIADRFIPSRTSTPSKDALMLQSSSEGHHSYKKSFGQRSQDADPFAPSPRRSLRLAEQYATTRNTPVATRPVRLPRRNVTTISEARASSTRATSVGAVWSVGGSIVTEGVASTSNGRGGRITSGSNASHYFADFLQRNSPSEEEVIHGKRLAIAMDIDQSARVLQQSALSGSSPSIPGSLRAPASRQRVFRDGTWDLEGSSLSTKTQRKISKDVPIIPFRVLDAPSLRDDFYCSLLAYSRTVECLAVGLGPHVYLWTENRKKTNIPDSLNAPPGSAHVTSVSFSSTEGGSAILAIGRADGRITLWSPLDRDPRFDSEQPAPVSCVAFRPNSVRRPSIRDSIATVSTEELLVGDEVGSVYLYSVEWPNTEQRNLFDWHGSMTLLARIQCHSQQVCGIAWSLDGNSFATGGNDNHLYLYETESILKAPTQSTSVSPTIRVNVLSGTSNSVAGQGEVLNITPGQEKHIFTLNAAVKAIAFAPWQSSLIAAGGGSNDRCIHFFHAHSGARLATIDCYAQVTALVWSPRRREIAATLGFAQPEHAYRVAVFGWPGGDLLVAIPWWTEERALYAIAYPRGPRSLATQSTSDTAHAVDVEGRSWYGRRTREEGCLVVATSDASIKFHEIWAERPGDRRKPRVASTGTGLLGGSQILEDECSEAMERREVIR